MTSPGALHEATAVAERSAELAQEQWDRLDATDTVLAVEALIAAKNHLDAALLQGIERLEDTNALHGLGWASAKEFLTHLTGGHKGTGGGMVRAMNQIRSLPLVQAALNDGRVTLPQARAIAAKVRTLPDAPQFRDAVADSMLALVDEHGHDASDLQIAFADIVRQHDPDGEFYDAEKEKAKAERGAHHERHLSFAEDDFGGVRIKGYGTVEDVELIKTTLLPLSAPVTTEPGACGGHRPSRGPSGTREPEFDEHGEPTHRNCPTPNCGHDGRDPRDHGTRLWDALVEACTRLQNTDTLPRDHGTRSRVMVLIDQDSLKQQVIDAGLARPGHTITGGHMSAHAIRRLACDADIIPTVLGSDGQILDVGRSQRLVTPAQWMALIARDRHCAFPGCNRMPLACDAHHIVHWADGGTTALDNMIMLCRHHHMVIHNSPWTVHIDLPTGQPVWTPPQRRAKPPGSIPPTSPPPPPTTTSPPRPTWPPPAHSHAA